jgi:hemerythrin
MALFNWSDKYSVQVKSVDDQHRHLIGILNRLHDAMTKGKGASVTGPLLHELVEYTQTHFATEERIMEGTRYPGLAAHRTRHRELTTQVEDFVARSRRGEVALNISLLNFLRDWLNNHIMKEDKGYSPWLNEHGVH